MRAAWLWDGKISAGPLVSQTPQPTPRPTRNRLPPREPASTAVRLFNSRRGPSFALSNEGSRYGERLDGKGNQGGRHRLHPRSKVRRSETPAGSGRIRTRARLSPPVSQVVDEQPSRPSGLAGKRRVPVWFGPPEGFGAPARVHRQDGLRTSIRGYRKARSAIR